MSCIALKSKRYRIYTVESKSLETTFPIHLIDNIEYMYKSVTVVNLRIWRHLE